MSSRNRLTAGVAVATALIVGAAACHPGGISDIGDRDVVLTLVDTTVDFSTVGTYAMPDTIIRVDEDGGSDEANPAVDAVILNEIAAQFAALGYTRVDVGGAEPDVIVLVEAARSDFTTLVPVGPSWWDWWGYWPGWGPGWGPCCPGPGWGPTYPWIPVPVTQTTGTLTIKMLDPEATVGDESIPMIWLGLINGLLEGSDASIVERADDLLDQLFVQSPYL